MFDFFSGTNYVIQKWNPARDGVGVGLIILESTQTLIVDESFRICHSSPNSETIGLIPPQKRDQLPKYPTKREHLFNEIAFSFFETYIREISKCLIESRNAVSIFKCISSWTLFCNCSWKKKHLSDTVNSLHISRTALVFLSENIDRLEIFHFLKANTYSALISRTKTIFFNYMNSYFFILIN